MTNQEYAASLTTVQWCLLDLLMRARQKGVHQLNRLELVNTTGLPQGLLLNLAWTALVMPTDLVKWHDKHNFSITEQGIAVFNLRARKPTAVADSVIHLPGPDHAKH